MFQKQSLCVKKVEIRENKVQKKFRIWTLFTQCHSNLFPKIFVFILLIKLSKLKGTLLNSLGLTLLKNIFTI